MKYLFITAALLLALLGSCGRNEPAEPAYAYDLTFEYALANALNRRESITKPDYNAFALLADERARLGDEWVELWCEEYLTELVMQSLTPIARAESISYEEAIADAYTLLMLLRMNYGAYTYYGGDDVFVPLFDRIFEALAQADEWNTGDDFGDFAELLQEHLLEVIVDNHVHIGFRPLGALDSFTITADGIDKMPLGITADFFVGSIRFERSVNGFRSQETGLYVASVADHSIDEVFRLSVDDNGEFSYIPIVMIPGRSGLQSYPLTLTFYNGEQETLILSQHEPHQRGLSSPSLTWANGIPIVRITSMGFYPNQEYAQRFLGFAEELRDEPVVIVDIRSNRGGNNLLSAQFLHRLTGEVVPSNSVILHLGNHHETMETFAAVPSDSPIYRPLSDLIAYHPSTPLGESHFVFNYTPDRLVQNDQLVIFLIDRYTMSAGEGFVDFSLNLQNSLIIGQNTGGVLQKTGGPGFFLPNSGIMVGFGPGLFLYPDNLFAEGVGFAPDVWVMGDALTAALAILQY